MSKLLACNVKRIAVLNSCGSRFSDAKVIPSFIPED